MSLPTDGDEAGLPADAPRRAGSDEAVAAGAIDRLEPLVEVADRPQMEMIIEQAIAQVRHHSGPLPPAEELVRYREVDPSFAERIVAMAEREQTFRHGVSEGLLARNYALKSRGQHYALAIAALVLLFATYLAYLGDTKMAGGVAIATLAVLVGTFVGGRAIDARARDRERADPPD